MVFHEGTFRRRPPECREAKPQSAGGGKDCVSPERIQKNGDRGMGRDDTVGEKTGGGKKRNDSTKIRAGNEALKKRAMLQMNIIVFEGLQEGKKASRNGQDRRRGCIGKEAETVR